MSWQINPQTGDYLMTNGAPVDDPSLIYPAYYRIKVRRTQWQYAPGPTYGSDFWTIQKKFSAEDVSKYTDMAATAVQPIVDDGRAGDVSTEYMAPKSRYDVQLGVTLTDAQGMPQKLQLPVIGG